MNIKHKIYGISIVVVILFTIKIFFGKYKIVDRNDESVSSHVNDNKTATKNDQHLLDASVRKPKEISFLDSLEEQRRALTINTDSQYAKLVTNIQNVSVGAKREKAILALSSFLSANPTIFLEKIEELSKILTNYEIHMVSFNCGESSYLLPDGEQVADSILSSSLLSKEAKNGFAMSYFRNMILDDSNQAINKMLQLPNDIVLQIIKYNSNSIGRYQIGKKIDVITNDQIVSLVNKFKSDSLNSELLESIANVDAVAERDMRDVSQFQPKLSDSYQESYFIHLAEEDMDKALNGLSSVSNPVVKDNVIFTLLPMIKAYDAKSAGLWAAQISNSELRSKALKNVAQTR